MTAYRTSRSSIDRPKRVRLVPPDTIDPGRIAGRTGFDEPSERTFAANLNLFDDLAACFETLGDSVAVLRNMLPDAEAFPEVFNRAMDLAAEAQSMLRNAVNRIDGPNDNDQNAVFHWLKRTAAAMQVFIQALHACRRHGESDQGQ